MQLLALFTLSFAGLNYELALVLPMDGRIDSSRDKKARDLLLRLTRVQPRRRSDAVVIDIKSLIRGGLLVEDYASVSGERLVVNFVDQDIWLRMKSADLVHNVKF